MKKIFGLMFGALAIALVSAPSSAQMPFDPDRTERPLAQGRPAAVAPTVAAPQVKGPTAVAPAAVVTTLPASLPAIPAEMPPALPVALALEPQAVPPAPAPPASLAVVAPPAPPAPPAPAAPPQASAPQKPPAPPATPKPAAAPKPPEPPQAPEPMLIPPGRERIDPDPVNIRFDVTIAYQAGTAAPVKRTAVLTVANNTGGGPGFERASLRSGNNVPVPTTTWNDLKESPQPKPVTSFSYRSVGLNVDVRNAALLPGNRVRATLNVEFSGVDEKTASSASAPSFPTFSQSISLYFDNGKPVLVAQSSDVVDNVERKQTVEVKATILR